MDYFWKDNKKNALAAGGAAVFVLVAWLAVIAPLRARADKAVRDLAAEERALQDRIAAGIPSPETVSVAEREVERFRQQLAGLSAELAFEVRDPYRKPAGETCKAQYDHEKIVLYKSLREKAKGLNAFPADFGLNAAGDEISEELAEELLARLAVVERLTLLAIASGVDRIDAINALYGAERGEDPVTRKGVFLNRYGVILKFKGTSASVFRVLHGVQKKKDFLAVAQFEAVREDLSKDFLSATLAVWALRIDPGSPIEPAPEEDR